MVKRVGMGRPPKMTGTTKLVTFRLPISLIKRLERYTKRMLYQGQPASRADAVRHLLTQGLDEADQRAAEFRETFSEIRSILGTPPRPKRKRHRKKQKSKKARGR